MASLAQKIQCETQVRELLEQQGVPQPDEVEYGHGCVRLFFSEPKVVLVVDIDDYTEVDEARRKRAEAGEPESPREPLPHREHDGRGPPFSMFPYPGPTQRN